MASLTDLNNYAAQTLELNINADMVVPEAPAKGIALQILTWDGIRDLGPTSTQGIRVDYYIGGMPIEIRQYGMSVPDAGATGVSITDQGSNTWRVEGIFTAEDYILGRGYIQTPRDYYAGDTFTYTATITNLDNPTRTRVINGTLKIYDSPEFGPLVLSDVDLVAGSCVAIEAPLILDSSAGNTNIPTQHFTPFSEAQVDTAQKQFGTGSLLLDGSLDYIKRNVSNDAQYDGFTEWTWECWIRASDFGSIDLGIGAGENSPGCIFKNGLLGTAGNYTVNIWNNLAGYTQLQAFGVSYNNFQLSENTWYHIAVTGSSTPGVGQVLYVNGNYYARLPNNTTLPTFDSVISIGANYWNLTNSDVFFNGHIDEMRFSSTIRYPWTGDEQTNPGDNMFTPPTAAFTTDSDTLLLLHMDGDDGSTQFVNDLDIEVPDEVDDTALYTYTATTTSNWTSLYLKTSGISDLTTNTWTPTATNKGKLKLVGTKAALNEHLSNLQGCSLDFNITAPSITPTVTPSYTSGIDGNAILINNFNVVIDDEGFETVEFWMKDFNVSNIATTLNVLLESNSLFGEMRLVMHDNYLYLSKGVPSRTSGEIRFDAADGYYIKSESQLTSTNTWYHIAVQKHPTDDGYTLWINGEQVLNGYNNITDTAIVNGICPRDPDHIGWNIGEEYGVTTDPPGVTYQVSKCTMDEFRASSILRYQSTNDFVNGQTSGTPTPFSWDEHTPILLRFNNDITNVYASQAAGSGTITYQLINPVSFETSTTTQDYS